MPRETVIVSAGTVREDIWDRLVKLRVARVSNATVIATPEGHSGVSFSVPAKDLDIVLEELRRRGYEVTTFHKTEK